ITLLTLLFAGPTLWWPLIPGSLLLLGGINLLLDNVVLLNMSDFWPLAMIVGGTDLLVRFLRAQYRTSACLVCHCRAVTTCIFLLPIERRVALTRRCSFSHPFSPASQLWPRRVHRVRQKPPGSAIILGTGVTGRHLKRIIFYLRY